jgi:hypothetical protein
MPRSLSAHRIGWKCRVGFHRPKRLVKDSKIALAADNKMSEFPPASKVQANNKSAVYRKSKQIAC